MSLHLGKPGKLALFGLLGLAATITLAPRADAGWGALYKPDLVVAKIVKSNINSNYVYVVVSNPGQWSSTPCYARAIVYGTTTKVGYFPISSIAAGSAVGFDIWVGTSFLGQPGLVTRVDADIFGQVAESNESNNYKYFVAPAG